ncbi:hypothetical protein SS50377_22910 [Spironucleus salmonicida]|uniref:Uncharacterized protein n=1 Tax=Spironucleus salmonicida TaxID=348837 RepID=A0A9P8LVR3_9EUKA|nr:hypothetical protein SS50377_22910 [Spironucleus salmonicida]
MNFILPLPETQVSSSFLPKCQCRPKQILMRNNEVEQQQLKVAKYQVKRKIQPILIYALKSQKSPLQILKIQLKSAQSSQVNNLQIQRDPKPLNKKQCRQ